MSQSAMDVKKLLSNSSAVENNTLWTVKFHALMPVADIPEEALAACPDCGEEPDVDDIRSVVGELTVLAGSDSQAAIDKVREYVLAEGLESFQLRSVNLVGEADVIA